MPLNMIHGMPNLRQGCPRCWEEKDGTEWAKKNEEARTVKAGFSFQDLWREGRYANLGHLLPIFPIERAVKPGVSAPRGWPAT